MLFAFYCVSSPVPVKPPVDRPSLSRRYYYPHYYFPQTPHLLQHTQ